MKALPWLNQQSQWWLELMASQNIPHAILLKGDKGLGKSEFAWFMAESLLCQEKQADKRPCGNCSSCHLFASGNHTDFFSVKAEKNIIKIDQIRKMSESVTLSSAQGSYQVVLIHEIEKLNSSSANALLKTLEEPSAQTLIILTCNEYDNVLPTIKSRCIKLDFFTPETAVAKKWLEDELNASEQVSEQDVDLALFYASGSPLLAEKILSESLVGEIALMVEDMNQIKRNQTSVVNVAKSWIKDEKFDLLKYVVVLLLSQYRKSTLGIASFEPPLSLEILNPKKVPIFLSMLNLLLKRLDTPLKKELLIEELLINWQNV